MVNYDEIMVALRKEIDKLRIEGTSQRLPTLGDHDHIVGIIEGVNLSIDKIIAIKKREEDIDGDEDFT